MYKTDVFLPFLSLVLDWLFLQLLDSYHSFYHFLLLSVDNPLSFIWYKPHNSFKFLRPLFSFHQLSLPPSLCLFLCHRSMCFTVLFSYPIKTHLFNLGPHRHSLGQNSCEDKVRVRVISTKPIGKRQHRRRKRFQWPSGSLTRLSIIPGLQREQRERERKREMPQCIPALQIMFQLEASQHSRHRLLSGRHSTGSTHTCSRQHTSTIRYVSHEHFTDIAKTNSVELWLLNLLSVKMWHLTSNIWGQVSWSLFSFIQMFRVKKCERQSFC